MPRSDLPAAALTAAAAPESAVAARALPALPGLAGHRGRADRACTCPVQQAAPAAVRQQPGSCMPCAGAAAEGLVHQARQDNGWPKRCCRYGGLCRETSVTQLPFEPFKQFSVCALAHQSQRTRRFTVQQELPQPVLTDPPAHCCPQASRLAAAGPLSPATCCS